MVRKIDALKMMLLMGNKNLGNNIAKISLSASKGQQNSEKDKVKTFKIQNTLERFMDVGREILQV